MGDIMILTSDEFKKSSEVVQWEKFLPKTVIRVLLVESDDSTRQILTALLRKCCYKVVAVCDGLAAWEILKEKSCNIDLVLTELDLPSISGFALLALVMEHESRKNIPVIMMSSQDSIGLVLKCMLRGAADYLIKPMRKNELKNLWQHVWRRLTLRDDPTAHANSLPGSQHNLEDSDETSGDSRYHSDQGSGAQVTSYNGHNKQMAEVKQLDSSRIEKKNESMDVTMDLIGGIDKNSECFNGDSTRDDHVGPELGLSLKRMCSVTLENERKQQKIVSVVSDASAFSRYENGKAVEKPVVTLEPSSSGEPKTPTESHEKLRNVRSDRGSATTSSNQENIGSSSGSGQYGQNQVLQSTVTNQKQNPQESSPVPVESNLSKPNKELEQSSSVEKPMEEDSLTLQQRWSQREAALMKFRLKRKDRCFDKKVRYQSRKKLAEQRPRVKGQFVRAANSDASTKA